MPRWLKRVRGAIGMGITWAIGWAFGGLAIGVLSILVPGRVWDVFFRFFDAPLPVLAVPGFVGGTLFSLVLSIAARRQRFDELSLARVTTWGAIGGVLLGLVPFVFGDVAEGTSASMLGIVVITICTALSAVSAAASLLIARRASRRDARGDTPRDARRDAMTNLSAADALPALNARGRDYAESLLAESLLDERVNAKPVGE